VDVPDVAVGERDRVVSSFDRRGGLGGHLAGHADREEAMAELARETVERCVVGGPRQRVPVTVVGVHGQAAPGRHERVEVQRSHEESALADREVGGQVIVVGQAEDGGLAEHRRNHVAGVP
jgi:hypothetical protein